MQWWIVKRRIHTSWLIAILCCAVLVGVASAQWMNGFDQIAWIVSSAGLAGIILWRRNAYLIPLLIIAGFVCGLWRGSIEQSQLTVYKNLYQSKVVLVGKVSDDPDIDKTGGLVLRISESSINKHQLPGKLWVTAATKYDIKRGDIVTAKGVLKQGFGNFAGTVYRANITKVQRPEPGDIARQVRDWFADAVRVAIPDPQSSLGIGYLVGQRRALPPDLSEALKIAGLTHVVVASGYNLTILVRLARRLFMKVSKYVSALSATTMILTFIAITGASPSMSRAGLVSGLSLAAWYYGRAFHPLVLLPFAAAITVIIDPSYAWNDLGWQLSFAAFGGVMIVAPLMQRYFFGDKKPGTLRQILGETVSAHIVTLPILVLAFGQFSNIAIFSNLLILPFVPLAMLLTFIAGIGALIFPPIATLVGLPANWLLEYMIAVTQYLAKLPWAQTELQINSWIVATAYALIIAACFWMWRATKFDLRDSNLVE
jgi:competence protein ComEC